MTPKQKIKKLFKKSNVTVDSNFDEKTLTAALSTLEKSHKTESPILQPKPWRIIMNKPITKLATIAAVFLIVASTVTILNHSTTPAYAIEQTIEALNGISTVRIIARGWDDELMNIWMQINPETGKAEHTYLETPFFHEGQVFEFVIVSTPEVSYQYNKTDNVVKIYEKQLIKPDIEFENILESIAEGLEENESMEIYHGKDPESDNEVIVLFTRSMSNTTKFLIDRTTKLPLNIENFGPKKTDFKRTEKIIYNEPLPEGILNFQIPEGAKVINISDIDKLLDNPEAGIPVDGLSKEEASALIAEEYWLAQINKDWARLEKLRPIHTAEQWKQMKNDNVPIELLKVGQTYWQKGCSEPVTPCVVKYKNGKVFETKTYPRFRDYNGQRTCVIGGIYAQSKQLNQQE